MNEFDLQPDRKYRIEDVERETDPPNQRRLIMRDGFRPAIRITIPIHVSSRMEKLDDMRRKLLLTASDSNWKSLRAQLLMVCTEMDELRQKYF